MTRRVLAQRLEQIECAHDIRLDIGARVLGAVAHARLGGEVEHDIGVGLGDQACECVGVLELRFACQEAFRSRELLVAAALEIGIVVGCEAVDAEDGVSIGKQALRQMETDEACRAGNKKAHTSAADLKFLYHLQRTLLGTSNRKAALELWSC